jgi:hypothetical protein
MLEFVPPFSFRLPVNLLVSPTIAKKIPFNERGR